MHTWQAQEAKAKFSKLLDECQKEPQPVTRHGEVTAYVVSAKQYDKLVYKSKGGKKTTVGALFRKSPLYASGIELDLRRHYMEDSHRAIHFTDEADS
jgi:prevent-host-death family protein